MSRGHHSSLRGILKQSFNTTYGNYIPLKRQMVSTMTQSFSKPRLAQLTEPLIGGTVLKQAFKILNSKINFLNISCQSL